LKKSRLDEVDLREIEELLERLGNVIFGGRVGIFLDLVLNIVVGIGDGKLKGISDTLVEGIIEVGGNFIFVGRVGNLLDPVLNIVIGIGDGKLKEISDTLVEGIDVFNDDGIM